MKTAEERILELAKKHAIGDAEAAQLLDAVGSARPAPGLSALLQNPFERFGGEATSVVGLVVAALGVLATRFHVRFDGAFDVHTHGEAVTLLQAVLDQVLAFPFTALVFWLLARVHASGTRYVDVLGVVGVSRAPSTLAALLLGVVVGADVGPGKLTMGFIVAVCLAALGLQFYWLYRGVSTARGRRDGRTVVVFVTAIIASEILSKLVLQAY